VQVPGPQAWRTAPEEVQELLKYPESKLQSILCQVDNLTEWLQKGGRRQDGTWAEDSRSLTSLGGMVARAGPTTAGASLPSQASRQPPRAFVERPPAFGFGTEPEPTAGGMTRAHSRSRERKPPRGGESSSSGLRR